MSYVRGLAAFLLVFALAISATMSGCINVSTPNDAPYIRDMLAQIHSGMTVDDVEALLGPPDDDKVSEWEEYIDDSRSDTRTCLNWHYIVHGLDEWSVSFQFHDGVVWGWTAHNGDKDSLLDPQPYIPGFDGDRPDSVYPLTQLYVGMPMAETEAAFGPPDNVEQKSTIVGKRDEDWDYHFQPREWSIYLRFEDGLLRSWFANGYDYDI